MHTFPARSVGGLPPATNFVTPTLGPTAPTPSSNRFIFSTTTTDSDPGLGNLRLDNATQASATVIRADISDADGNIFSDFVDQTFSFSPTATKGMIRLVHATNPAKWILFALTAVASPSGYRNLTVVFKGISGSNPFANGDSIFVTFDGLGAPIATGDLTTTATNDDAAAGKIGEFIWAELTAASATALTTITQKTIISISLTAGDWDVTGVISFIGAATTSITRLIGSSSSVNNTIGGTGTRFDHSAAAWVPGSTSNPSYVIPTRRWSLASTTTIYLVAMATFTVSTMTAYGLIQARRMR